MWDFPSILDVPCGSRTTLLVEPNKVVSEFVFGTEIPFGQQVVFQIAGGLEHKYITIYDAVKTNQFKDDAILLELDDQSTWFPSRTPNCNDLRFLHDVCAGMGGFSTGFVHLGGQVVSAVDISSLACVAYHRIFDHVCLHADIGDPATIRLMHKEQFRFESQPIMAAGFPCQPLSPQGSQLRSADPRSRTLLSILRAAALLRSVCVVLECVPEAWIDHDTQQAIRAFCSSFGYHLEQIVLPLHHVWPSKRTRWFAVCISNSLGSVSFVGFPQLSSPRTVGELIPDWPQWSTQDETQLCWTELEQQVYYDPTYGNPDRRVDLSLPLPTALHSWGSALYQCPCLCRKQGLSPARLRADGLRGVAVISTLLGKVRHIHPKELQLLLGFPPAQPCGNWCRADLCLLGNSVSPIHTIWIFSQLIAQVGGDVHKSPVQVLQMYLNYIVAQQTLVWPPKGASALDLTLVFEDSRISLSFFPGATVAQLLSAEGVLSQEACSYHVWCEGVKLAPDAFLQAREYRLIKRDTINPAWPLGLRPILCFLWHLGVVRTLVVPSGITIAQVLRWRGIQEWIKVVTPNGSELSAESLVCRGQHFVVQLDPAELTLDFEIISFCCRHSALTETGFGFGPLQISSSWNGLGLGHLDELTRNNLLASWSGSKFAPLSVWLPSFSAAILEVWPHTIEESLKSWLHTTVAHIFVIFQEDSRWGILAVRVNRLTTEIHFFDGYVSETARHLAYRIERASGRACYREIDHQADEFAGPSGSLAKVLNVVDGFLNIPEAVKEALVRVRSKYGAVRSFGSFNQLSATLPLSMPDSQLPTVLHDEPSAEFHGGLSATFILDFARALVSQSPVSIDPSQIKVLMLDEDHLDQVKCVPFQGGPAPLYLFVLANQHWTFMLCDVIDSVLCVTHFDGLHATDLASIECVCTALKTYWAVTSHRCETTWKVAQRRLDSCGTIAIAHFALCLGFISEVDAIGFEDIHPSLVLCSSVFSPHHRTIGFGPEAEIIQALTELLPDKGVDRDSVAPRAQAAIKVFGCDAISKALASKNPWASLKTLGNSKPRPFKWVTSEELQTHIQERASQKFGVNADVKRSKKPRSTHKAAPSADLLDLSSLVLPPNIFVTSTGQVVSQIALAAVQKDACGVAFARASEVTHFLQEGRMISPEALSLLVVGKIPDLFLSALPMHQIRVPAIYKGTNEPILVDCVSIQLGDQAVYRKVNQAAPEFSVFPTVVFRAHVFRDLWENEMQWTDLVAKPIKTLVHCFGQFRLCRDESCSGDCHLFHPAIEESGVESGLLDVWGFAWHRLDGSKIGSDKAEVLSLYVRVPESNFNPLHLASGSHGVFFEPRLKNTPGPDPTYAVLWIPQQSLSDIQHRVKTNDKALAVCRLGTKYGIRCLAKHQEELHRSLNLKKPFVGCTVKQVYRIEPLPAGTQRQSIADICKSLGWTAKPLQPCKGSQGCAWEIGAEQAPPTPFIDAQHGWTTITKVRDVAPPSRTSDLVATQKTKQHIREGVIPAASSSSTIDPWHNGADPWSNFKGLSTGVCPPSQHVQQKFDDVEQRLHDSVKAQVSASVEQISAQINVDDGQDDRISAVEQQVQALMQGQQNLEQWMQDGNTKITELQSGYEQVHCSLGQCANTIQAQGQTIAHVASEVAQCSSSLAEQGSSISQVAKEVGGLKEALGSQLATYFDQQSSRIEALLAKKQRQA